MKRTLYQKEYVSIILDSSTPAIYEEWFGAINLTEFQTTLEKKLALYLEHRNSIDSLKLILNLRGMYISDQGIKWFNEVFYPKLYPNGVEQLALVLPDNSFHKLENHQLSPHKDSQNQIELCYFDDLEEASQWVAEKPSVFMD